MFLKRCFSKNKMYKKNIFPFFVNVHYVAVWKGSDPNPYWSNNLDPDPNAMYLDPQHICNERDCLGEVFILSAYFHSLFGPFIQIRWSRSRVRRWRSWSDCAWPSSRLSFCSRSWWSATPRRSGRRGRCSRPPHSGATWPHPAKSQTASGTPA